MSNKKLLQVVGIIIFLTLIVGAGIVIQSKSLTKKAEAPFTQPKEVNVSTVDITLDVLQALADFYLASVTTSTGDDFVGTMTALLNQNKYLESGKISISGHVNNSNEVIQLTARGMSLGADKIIKANNEVIQYIRTMDSTDPNSIKEFEYIIASYLSNEKDGYKTIAISAPQIGSLFFDPAETDNPSGAIPYKISKQERKRLLDEIERLFGKYLKEYRQDVINETGSYNAILFSVNSLHNNLYPDTYEEASKIE